MKSRIEYIEISNFKVIESLTLEFPDTKEDIWVIGGRNGIGKTTVLEACYRLIKDKWAQDERIQGRIAHNNAHIVYLEANRKVDVLIMNDKRRRLLLQIGILEEYPSYGQVHLVSMMEAIVNCQAIPTRLLPHFVLIDNPELFLDADLQCRFMQWIKKFPHQFIIATHSEHILNAVSPSHRFVLASKPPKHYTQHTQLFELPLYVTRQGGANDTM